MPVGVGEPLTLRRLSEGGRDETVYDHTRSSPSCQVSSSVSVYNPRSCATRAAGSMVALVLLRATSGLLITRRAPLCFFFVAIYVDTPHCFGYETLFFWYHKSYDTCTYVHTLVHDIWRGYQISPPSKSHCSRYPRKRLNVYEVYVYHLREQTAGNAP